MIEVELGTSFNLRRHPSMIAIAPQSVAAKNSSVGIYSAQVLPGQFYLLFLVVGGDAHLPKSLDSSK